MSAAKRSRRGAGHESSPPAGSGPGEAPESRGASRAGGPELEPFPLTQHERELVEWMRANRGAPGVVRETAVAPFGTPYTPPSYPMAPVPGLAGYGSRKRPSTERPRAAAPGPEQYMVMGDYYRARQGFASDAELARAIGVHRSRVTAWKNGELPDRDNARLLAGLGVVVGELMRFLDPGVVSDWLTTGQAEAGGRAPVALLREGRLAEVLQLANATEYGAFV